MISPDINLGTIWRWVFDVRTWLLYSRGSNSDTQRIGGCLRPVYYGILQVKHRIFSSLVHSWQNSQTTYSFYSIFWERLLVLEACTYWSMFSACLCEYMNYSYALNFSFKHENILEDRGHNTVSRILCIVVFWPNSIYVFFLLNKCIHFMSLFWNNNPIFCVLYWTVSG
jgi:hypothetical protein